MEVSRSSTVSRESSKEDDQSSPTQSNKEHDKSPSVNPHTSNSLTKGRRKPKRTRHDRPGDLNPAVATENTEENMADETLPPPLFENDGESWVYELLQDRLQSLEVGSLGSHDFVNARDYLSKEAGGKKDIVKGDLLEEWLWILDRLAKEWEVHDPDSLVTGGYQALPYHSTLDPILALWAIYMNSVRETSGTSVKKDGYEKGSPPDRTPTTVTFEQLRPLSILEKVNRYLHVGFVAPPYANAYLHIVQGMINMNSHNLYGRADEVFQYLMDQADTRYRPNGPLIKKLLQLCRQRLEMDPSSANTVISDAERYFQSIHVNDFASQPEEYRPSPDLYCDMIELYGKTRGNELRMLELYQQMRGQQQQSIANTLLRYDARHAERVLRVLVESFGTQSPSDQVLHLARSIVDEVCESFMATRDSRWKPTVRMFELMEAAYQNTNDRGAQISSLRQLRHHVESLVKTPDNNTYVQQARVTNKQRLGNSSPLPPPPPPSSKPPPTITPRTARRPVVERTPEEQGGIVFEALQRLVQDLKQGANASHMEQAVVRFQQMVDAQSNPEKPLTIESMNLLLQGLTGLSPSFKGALLAERIVHWMEETNSNTGLPKPNGESYVRVIQAWKSAKDPGRCQVILDHLCRRVKQENVTLSDNPTMNSLPQVSSH